MGDQSHCRLAGPPVAICSPEARTSAPSAVSVSPWYLQGLTPVRRRCSAAPDSDTTGSLYLESEANVSVGWPFPAADWLSRTSSAGLDTIPSWCDWASTVVAPIRFAKHRCAAREL